MLDVNVSFVNRNEKKCTLPCTYQKNVQGVAMMDKKLRRQKMNSVDVVLHLIVEQRRSRLLNAKRLAS